MNRVYMLKDLEVLVSKDRVHFVLHGDTKEMKEVFTLSMGAFESWVVRLQDALPKFKQAFEKGISTMPVGFGFYIGMDWEDIEELYTSLREVLNKR